MRHIGVDLHKNSFLVCFLKKEEKEKKKYKIEEIEQFKKSLRKTDKIAVESTTNTRYFVEQIRGRVKEVVIVNPTQFRIISQSVKKTDEEDAERIALYLSKSILPEVRMKEKTHSQINSMANTRDKLVKLRTVLKNKIHNILSAHGILSKKEDFTSEKGLSRVVNYQVDDAAQIELEVIVEQIRHLNEGIKRLEEQMTDRGKGLKGYENITSIKGIGKKGGTILLSVIGDINDFETEKKLASYFGIVPRVNNSNEKVHMGRITKQGSALGRTTLVQCTLIAKRYSPFLNKFYERIKQKKGSGKAIIATARKFLGIIYNTLKNDWIFEDFPNFVIKNSQ
jgi:transposase